MDQNCEIKDFISQWQDDSKNIKGAFVDYMNYLESNPDIITSFKARPHISYSLRAKDKNQKARDLFVLIDVVDDDPQDRWLSVCFYADYITDPEDKGDLVPSGLFGEDAVCFNLDEDDKEMRQYIKDRLVEAAGNAKIDSKR